MIKTRHGLGGRVTDSQGLPIINAKVKEFHTYGHRKLSVETDDDGSFLLLGVSHPNDSKAEIVVQAEGMAPQLQTIQLRDPTNIINFALTNGNVFRGHVVDETGQFIAGAAVQTDSDNQGRRPFRWFTHTDLQGGFLWDSAPAEPVLFWFEAEGYEPIRDLLLKADGREYEIKLKRKPK